MTESHLRTNLVAARAAIARCIVRAEEPCDLRVGDVTLHAHQRSAVDRLRRMLSSGGGALLCDDVGLGKTYIALAVAARYDSVIVIAPAVLVSMWRSALAITRVAARTVSLESLGRSGIIGPRPSLVVVDEAHHFRNPATRRYAALAGACACSPVLLLSATPLHNSRDDVASLAALFIGSRAYSMSDDELGALVVRRSRTAGYATQHVPVVEHASPRVLVGDEEILERILSLPPPVPPSGGSVATRLVVHGLVRQWVSSHAALIGALKRRIARSSALLSSLDAGRYPTASELAAWVYGGDAVQLAFTALLAPHATSLASLSTALREHVAGLEQLLVHATRRDDDAVVRFVREIRAIHSGEKVVVFTQYAETASAVYRGMKRHGHAALLTARAAVIASGPVSRADVLRQFAPSRDDSRRTADHERIDLLISTDVLSEGVDLHAASVIVHLDVPWTHARIQQRNGRLARLGSPHSRVRAYSVYPPPRAESVLRELEIVARKAASSNALLGDAPSMEFNALRQKGAVSIGESIRSRLESWLDCCFSQGPEARSPLVSFASADRSAFIGAWIADGEHVLLTGTPSGAATADLRDVAYALDTVADAVDESAQHTDARALADALRAAERWYDQHRAHRALGVTANSEHSGRASHAARRLARVADSAVSTASFADRARVAGLATRLRQAASDPLPVAVEWSLESIPGPADESAVDTILEMIERVRPPLVAAPEAGFECVAVIIVRDGATP